MSFVANKTVIITGSSSGIGRETAIALAARGAKLVLNARGRAPLEETTNACIKVSRENGFQPEHAMITGNAAQANVSTQLVQTALAIGNFTGFIHAAGVLAPGPALWEIDEMRYQAVFDASVTAAWLLIRHATPQLREVDGAFAVFLGSGAAEITQPGIAAYCAAKAAEEHMVRQFASETKEIAAMTYRPGIVDTPMQAEARKSTGEKAEDIRSIFAPWYEDGQLIPAQESADALVNIIENGVRRFHGRIATVKDGAETRA